MKVVRPIPKRMTEQYYQWAYEQGLTMQETNQAAVLAHDWHRKWTQQDEQNHTRPEADFYNSDSNGALLPVHYTSTTGNTVLQKCSSSVDDSIRSGSSSNNSFLMHGMELDRLRGAKNPSLGGSASGMSEMDDDQQLQRQRLQYLEEDRFKRTRLIVDSASQVISHESSSQEVVPTKPLFLLPEDRLPGSEISNSGSSYADTPQVKRRFLGAVVEDCDDEEEEYGDDEVVRKPFAPFPIRPNVVRPTAVRFHRPSLPLVEDTPVLKDKGIPQNISARREQELCVSPMSCSPGIGFMPSSRSPESYLATPLPVTSQQERQEVATRVVNIVEDEEDEQDVRRVDPSGMYVILNDETGTAPPTTITDEDAVVWSPVIDGEVEKARDEVLHSLAVTGGDVDSEKFKVTIDPLEKYFSKQELDTRPQVVGADSVNGMWLTLSKPNFFGCLGENDNGDPMYTLGRMSFDMFSPTNLVCSLQGNFNPVEVVAEEDRKAMLQAVPKSLREEVESGETVLRTYHVVTAFTIESSLAAFPDAPNKDVYRPIKGIMTTYGYSLPDPNTPNRHSIWFTGGRIEPNDDPQDIKSWKHLFDLHPPKRTFGEKAKLLAVQLLMGATVPKRVAEDGSMEYTFTRPLGGHGMAYVDVIYLDEGMRIVRGHRGTTFVFSRLPDPNLPRITDGSSVFGDTQRP